MDRCLRQRRPGTARSCINLPLQSANGAQAATTTKNVPHLTNYQVRQAVRPLARGSAVSGSRPAHASLRSERPTTFQSSPVPPSPPFFNLKTIFAGQLVQSLNLVTLEYGKRAPFGRGLTA